MFRKRVESEDGKSGRFVDRAVAPRYETRPNRDTTGGLSERQYGQHK